LLLFILTFSFLFFYFNRNAKVLYSNSVGKLKELEDRLIEGVKAKRLKSAINNMKNLGSQWKDQWSASDTSVAEEPSNSKVELENKIATGTEAVESQGQAVVAGPSSSEMHDRISKFLENPSEEAMLNAQFDFDDTSINHDEFFAKYFLQEKLLNFKTLCQANVMTDPDSIIPEAVRRDILRSHGLTKQNAILAVMLSCFILISIFAFLILGMTLFADGDAFSAGISSLLGASAGLVNIISTSAKDEVRLKRLASKLIDRWSYSQNDTGISLNDDLRQAVVRRAKHIQQLDIARRAELVMENPSDGTRG